MNQFLPCKICSLGLSLLTLISSNAISQSLINSTGNTLENSNFILEYSIGEIGITTLSDSHNYITQGFLQPILEFSDCNLLKLIPNAFSPNGDNLNDCFGVKYWPSTSNYEMRIYNRWGQLVFKTTNILECWNGNFKGEPQPAGAYVYTITATTDLCGQTSYKGSVVLVR